MAAADVTTNDVNVWIEQLYKCKPLSEQEIKRLCEKVRAFLTSYTVLYYSLCINILWLIS